LKAYLTTRVRAVEGVHKGFQGIAVGPHILINKLEDLNPQIKYSVQI